MHGSVELKINEKTIRKAELVIQELEEAQKGLKTTNRM